MALATTCPQCKTSFRVVPDQLKLRRGFVRCGRCRHVFAGIDHLRYVDDAQLGAEARAAGGDDAEWIVIGAPASDHPLFAGPLDDDASAAQTEQREEPAFEAPEEGQPLGDTSAGDASAEEAAAEEVPVAEAPVAETSADGARPGEAHDTARDTAHEAAAPLADAAPDDPPPPYVERYAGSAYDTRDDDESAIDYFSTTRTRGFADRRGLAAGLLALALAVALATQWVVAQRSAIAAQLPFAAPLLAAALAPFGLRIEAPDELDALTIESFELQASAVPDVLEMRALLRNRADHPVRWPSMQLTLTDPSSRVLVRRALHPDDYLPQADEARDRGVPAGTEWPLRLALEAHDLQAAGYDYRVQLFYPQERR
ncbi:MAG: DUF3426 domain-containing protein [Burkholderiaceae bacterium]|nr:DUF3426 domain-containing protein [Burkholderiaceae bacterium]